MAIDQEVAVGRGLVLADARLEDRSTSQPGEAPPKERPRQSQVVGVGHALPVRRVEARPDPVDPDLEPAVVDGRDAVATPGVVRPGRQHVPAPAGIALARAQVEDRLAGDGHQVAHGLGEELRKPGPGREHERARAPAPARLVDHIQEPVAIGPARPHGCQRIRAAGALERGDGGRDAAPCHQEPCLRLEQAERGAGGIDHRPAGADGSRVQALDGNAQRSQRDLGVGFPAGRAGREPQDSRSVEERDVPLVREAFPVAQRPPCPASVVAVRAVGTPDDPVLVR